MGRRGQRGQGVGETEKRVNGLPRPDHRLPDSPLTRVSVTGLGFEPRTYGLKVTGEDVALRSLVVRLALKSSEQLEAFEALSYGEIG